MSNPPDPRQLHDLTWLPGQSLQWLGRRLDDLLVAGGRFLWALFPWLVLAAVAAVIAAVVSADARQWLIIRAQLAGAWINGQDHDPPGFLYIEAPQVYTRERLVNDRFTQANWLREQLERTSNDSFVEAFAAPSHSSDEIRRLMLSLNAVSGSAVAAASRDDDADDDMAQALAAAGVQLDRQDLFNKVNTYRDILRSELMDVQLDDGHDLDGNTLYRLNFNAVVTPFFDRRDFPGSAVFLIRASPPDQNIQWHKDNEELLRQWQREMQSFLSRVLEQRLEEVQARGAVANPTDPKEDLALSWFVRNWLDEILRNRFKQLPASAVTEYCNSKERRAGECDPVMDPVFQARLMTAIEQAHLVNQTQWPKAGPWSYDKRCVDSERKKHAQPKADETQTDSKSVQQLTTSVRTTETPREGISDAAVTPNAELIEAFANNCLAAYADPYRLRAMARLISVITELEGGLPTQAVGSGEPGEASASKVDSFGNALRQSVGLVLGLAPLSATGTAGLAGMEGADPGNIPLQTEVPNESRAVPTEGATPAAMREAFPPFGTIAHLKTTVDSLVKEGKQLDDLLSICPEGNDAMFRALCRFVYGPFPDMRGLLAEFVVARVNGQLTDFYHASDPILTEFLTVTTTDRCLASGCRILVALNADAAEGKSKAQTLYEALNERTNGLSIYELSPRAETTVRHATDRTEITSALAAPQAAASAGMRRQDGAAYAWAAVLGFADVQDQQEEKESQAEASTVFGWTVRPQRLPDGGWSSTHHRFGRDFGSQLVEAPEPGYSGLLAQPQRRPQARHEPVH